MTKGKERKIKVLKVFLLVLVCVFLVAFAAPNANVNSYHYKNMSIYERQDVSLIFESKEELDAYLLKFNDSDKTKEMKKDLQRFDDEYFKENILVLVNVNAKSGSLEFNITNVNLENEVLTICLTSFGPTRVSHDIAFWNIFIEYKKVELKETVVIKDGRNISYNK